MQLRMCNADMVDVIDGCGPKFGRFESPCTRYLIMGVETCTELDQNIQIGSRLKITTQA